MGTAVEVEGSAGVAEARKVDEEEVAGEDPDAGEERDMADELLVVAAVGSVREGLRKTAAGRTGGTVSSGRPPRATNPEAGGEDVPLEGEPAPVCERCGGGWSPDTAETAVALPGREEVESGSRRTVCDSVVGAAKAWAPPYRAVALRIRHEGQEQTRTSVVVPAPCALLCRYA